MALALLVFGAGLVLAALALYDSLHVVEEGTPEAILVFGEMVDVLRPGLNVVPPFVSKTYLVDPGTMTMDTGDDRVAVLPEFEDEVREAEPGDRKRAPQKSRPVVIVGVKFPKSTLSGQ